MTTDGTLTDEIHVPTGTVPFEITTVGNAVWFSEQNSSGAGVNGVGKIDTSAPPTNSSATFSGPSSSDKPYTRQVTVNLSPPANKRFKRFELGWSTSSTTAPTTSYLQTITNMSTRKGPMISWASTREAAPRGTAARSPTRTGTSGCGRSTPTAQPTPGPPHFGYTHLKSPSGSVLVIRTAAAITKPQMSGTASSVLTFRSSQTHPCALFRVLRTSRPMIPRPLGSRSQLDVSIPSYMFRQPGKCSRL